MVQAIGGLVVQAIGGLVVQAIGGLVVQAIGGLVVQAIGGLVVQAIGGLVVQAIGGLVVQATGGLHCAKNRIYAIVYFAYISSIRTNIRVRIREISHWYILRIEQFRTAYISSILKCITCAMEDSLINVSGYYTVPTLTVYCIGYATRLCSLYTGLISIKIIINIK